MSRAEDWGDHIGKSVTQLFNILSLTMMENVVYEINEMKAKLKSHVFLRHSLKEVVGEHLCVFVRDGMREDEVFARRDGVFGAGLDDGLQHSTQLLQVDVTVLGHRIQAFLNGTLHRGFDL